MKVCSGARGNIMGHGLLSWNEHWGEWGDGGYINMKRGVNGNNLNMCQISDWAHYPVVTGSDDGTNVDDEEQGTEESKTDSVWCEIKNKELQGYATGKRVAMENLDQAKSACGALAECTGLTTEGDTYTLRSGSDLVPSAGSTTFLPGICPAPTPSPPVCTWLKVEKKRFWDWLTKRKLRLKAAQAACEKREDCVGVTCKSTRRIRCALVGSSKGRRHRKFDSYVLKCE